MALIDSHQSGDERPHPIGHGHGLKLQWKLQGIMYCSWTDYTGYYNWFENLNKEPTEPRWKPGMQGRGNRGGRLNYSHRRISNGGSRTSLAAKENGMSKGADDGPNQSMPQGQKNKETFVGKSSSRVVPDGIAHSSVGSDEKKSEVVPAVEASKGSTVGESVNFENLKVQNDSILFPEMPITLRLSTHLLLGVVRIYSKKVNYLFDDCSEALLKVKQAFRSTAVDLPPEETTAPYHSITLPETFDLDDFELPDNDLEGYYVDQHISSKDQITLQHTIEGAVYSTSKFGLDALYLSDKDPILMPSLDSRLPVGIIRREVGSQQTPVNQIHETPLDTESTAFGSEVGNSSMQGKAPSSHVPLSVSRPSSNYNNRLQQETGPQKCGGIVLLTDFVSVMGGLGKLSSGSKLMKALQKLVPNANKRITDGKAGVFEGGNWDRLITFKLDDLERREKGTPMVSP
ncbi:hypothetical protein L1987_13142 [Smallanthus sonchifolius]|uniref:Uncharacterized protein n=1 Tax=Smallanthus sonchifolius TaxID=185202 RepID=A0ACB9JGA7_9ASTR|nr:hypothetical protein L1987_13142 [Smallanthus sonchifolius]